MSIAKNVIFLPVARIHAGPVSRYVETLERSQFQSRRARDASRGARLRALVDHARRFVPHYQDQLRVAFADNMPMDELIAALPFLTKSELQRSAARLRSEGNVGRLISKTTGGSTGEPVTVWKTRDALAWELAATWRGYHWAGVDMGDRQARFWGISRDMRGKLRARITDLVCNRIRLSAFGFDDRSMGEYVERLNRARPKYFYGYVSMLEEFARFLRREKKTLKFPLKCVITTAEVLTAKTREALAQSYCAPVFNEYGCGELGTIAHECEQGSLHLTEENMLVEVLNGSRPCRPGEIGEIVVTELNNTGMPLIRYRTGDYASISTADCPCGRTLAILQGLCGRSYDFVRNRDGRLFHAEFIMYIFEDLHRRGPGIRRFQFIQEAIDRFRVRIVREEGFDILQEELIRNRVLQDIDPHAAVVFEYVDSIERARSGKMRLIVGLGRDVWDD